MKIQVFARKSSRTTFFVDGEFGIERAVVEMLNSDIELLWEDDPEGIKIQYIYENRVWSPKRRLTFKDESVPRRVQF
jgi:hypothetical protein